MTIWKNLYLQQSIAELIKKFTWLYIKAKMSKFKKKNYQASWQSPGLLSTLFIFLRSLGWIMLEDALGI